MPVENHEVHSSTIQSKDAKYGCWNKPRTRLPLAVKDGFDIDVTKHVHCALQLVKNIADFGSLECRYDKSLSDSKCKGCSYAGSGEEYSKKVHAKGS